MLVTIIIPVYNVHEYVEECLDSVLKQTYNDIQVIIIEDCSTDDSLAVCEDVISKYIGAKEVLLVKHEQNKGLSGARNTGLKHAKGEYVLFVDSDDTLSLTCVEDMAKEVERNDNVDMVIGDYDVSDGSNRFNPLREQNNTLSGEEVIASFQSGGFYQMAWNKLVKHKFLIDNNISFIEGIIHEDEPWTFQIACLANKVDIMHKVSYHYRVRSGSIQTAKEKQLLHDKAYTVCFENMLSFADNSNLLGNPYVYMYLEYFKQVLFFRTVLRENKSFMKEVYNNIRLYKRFPYINVLKDKHIKFYYKIVGLHYCLPFFIGIIIYPFLCTTLDEFVKLKKCLCH